MFIRSCAFQRYALVFPAPSPQAPHEIPSKPHRALSAPKTAAEITRAKTKRRAAPFLLHPRPSRRACSAHTLVLSPFARSDSRNTHHTISMSIRDRSMAEAAAHDPEHEVRAQQDAHADDHAERDWTHFEGRESSSKRFLKPVWAAFGGFWRALEEIVRGLERL
jgi:hypothetical protein